MRYSNVTVDALGYELAPNVVSSQDLENRLLPLYERLRISPGQLQAITGIRERRFWDPGYRMSTGAIAAGQKALGKASVDRSRIGMLVYGGVCRDNLEPATACAVAHGLGLGPEAQVYDVSNACLGILTGMLQVANAIELGHIRAGMVVACESSRQIITSTIDRMLAEPDMDLFRKTIATLTGGSGAAAVVLTAASPGAGGHPLLGGVVRNATEHHGLCRWGPDTGIPASGLLIMETDSVGVLQNGVRLGVETYAALRRELDWQADKPDKIICHQVGATHQQTILDAIGISPDKDFSTFRYLGNMGTVALPLTAAVADEREFLQPGDLVGFFGIGSGLNCLMLGIAW